MRGDEFPIDDFSLKLEDLLTASGQLTELSEQQVRRRCGLSAFLAIVILTFRC